MVNALIPGKQCFIFFLKKKHFERIFLSSFHCMNNFFSFLHFIFVFSLFFFSFLLFTFVLFFCFSLSTSHLWCTTSTEPRTFVREVLDDDSRPPLPRDLPHVFSKLMQLCWSADPGARPVFGKILDILSRPMELLLHYTGVTAAAGVVASDVRRDSPLALDKPAPVPRSGSGECLGRCKPCLGSVLIVFAIEIVLILFVIEIVFSICFCS